MKREIKVDVNQLEIMAMRLERAREFFEVTLTPYTAGDTIRKDDRLADIEMVETWLREQI